MGELGHVASAQRDETRLFRLSGEFDLSNAWKIQDALMEAIRHERRDIVVDLTDVAFMDGQLVRALIKARSAALRHDIAFVVIPPANQHVSRVADLVDFDVAA